MTSASTESDKIKMHRSQVAATAAAGTPDGSTTSLLDIRHLSIVFDTDDGCLTAVDDVSLTIRRGEILGLVGESGCGKSVAAMSIPRLIPSPPGRLVAGEIDFAGQNLATIPLPRLRQIRGNQIGVIFQDPMSALSPLHRIGRQMVETLRLHHPLTRSAARTIALEWLHKTGIPNPAGNIDAYPFQLSGGMRQRVMIAMALMLEPALIIADEPTTALDVTVQAQIFDLMRELRSRDTALLLITHDMGVIWEMCDRVLVMYAARIVESGDLRNVFGKPGHPYTEGLLRSMPALAPAETRRLPTIPGQVPSPLDYPEGCRFRDRCQYAMARCAQSIPPLYALGNGRQAACFLREPK